MFSYQSVNGADIVSLEDSEQKWNFWEKKMTFLRQNDAFFFFFFFFFFLRISEIFCF